MALVSILLQPTDDSINFILILNLYKIVFSALVRGVFKHGLEMLTST